MPFPVPAPLSLEVAWLLGTEPADRALSGWSPRTYALQEYGQLLLAHKLSPPVASGPPYPAGRYRDCAAGHEPVRWHGESACWCCGGQP
jgi:hypothetical protein